MVGPRDGAGEAGMALRPSGYRVHMPDIDVPQVDDAQQVGDDQQVEGDQQVEEKKLDQVLKREGLEEELMQQGRSEEAAAIGAVETGEETP